MAVSQLPQAPYRQDRRVYPTPDSGDILFSEVRDCTRSEIPEYGTPHPNPKKWPDHKLVFVKPVDIERDGIFEFFYAADRQNQDLYNFSFGLKSIGPNRQFRTVMRSYITLREDFKPLDIEFGTPMPNVPEDKFDGVEYVFFDRQQQPIDQQELNSLYVSEIHTYVEKAFLDDKLSYTAQRTDPLPEKFQILVPEQVVEQIVEGTAEMPTLTGSQLSVKEDQLNPNVKLVRTATRDRSTLPISLGQKSTTNEKQLATVTETIQTGDTDAVPTATVDIESQALGDGSYVVRKTEVPELFTAKSFTKQRTDPTPEKFRVLIPSENTEENIIGEAQMPILSDGEVEVSEQQINKFVKRKRTTKRDKPTSEVTLSGSQSYVGGTVADLTETYSPEKVDADSGFLIQESRVTPTGDGAYVKETVSVEEWPTLVSGTWDYAINGLAVRKQTMQDPRSLDDLEIPTTTKSIAYEAVNKDRVVLVEEYAPKEIDSYLFISKTRINLNLPPVLKSVDIYWEQGSSRGEARSSGGEDALSVDDGTVSVTSSGREGGTLSTQPIIDVRTEQIWSNDIIATNYFYYIQDADNYLSELNSKINNLSSPIQEWPVFKTNTYTIVGTGSSQSYDISASESLSISKSVDRESRAKSNSGSRNQSYSGNIDTIRIGPCLCRGLNLTNTTNVITMNLTPNLTNIGGGFITDVMFNATGSVRPTSLKATSPPDIPRSGHYVVDCRIEPYKWGYYKAIATVIDASQFSTPPEPTASIAPTIIIHPATHQAPAGTTATLTVVAEGEYLSYQWYKDGNEIPPNNIDDESAKVPSYIISNAQISDNGYYYVRVSNTAGSVLSNAAYFSVVPP